MKAQKATGPAKRKRGQPPRLIPRTRTLPRVSEVTHALLTAYATAHDCYLADAIEAAANALSLVHAADKPAKGDESRDGEW